MSTEVLAYMPSDLFDINCKLHIPMIASLEYKVPLLEGKIFRTTSHLGNLYTKIL